MPARATRTPASADSRKADETGSGSAKAPHKRGFRGTGV